MGEWRNRVKFKKSKIHHCFSFLTQATFITLQLKSGVFGKVFVGFLKFLMKEFDMPTTF